MCRFHAGLLHNTSMHIFHNFLCLLLIIRFFSHVFPIYFFDASVPCIFFMFFIRVFFVYYFHVFLSPNSFEHFSISPRVFFAVFLRMFFMNINIFLYILDVHTSIYFSIYFSDTLVSCVFSVPCARVYFSA